MREYNAYALYYMLSEWKYIYGLRVCVFVYNFVLTFTLFDSFCS